MIRPVVRDVQQDVERASRVFVSLTIAIADHALQSGVIE